MQNFLKYSILLLITLFSQISASGNWSIKSPLNPLNVSATDKYGGFYEKECKCPVNNAPVSIIYRKNV